MGYSKEYDLCICVTIIIWFYLNLSGGISVKKTLLMCILCFGITTGCAKTPGDVQNRVDILEENKINSEEVSESVKYGNLEDIRNQVDVDIENNNTIIEVNNARVGTGETMPVYDVETTFKNANEFHKICNYVFDEKYNLDNPNFFETVYKGDAMDPNYPAYEYPYDYDGDGIINNVNSYWFDIYSCYPDKKENDTMAVFLYGTGNCWGTNTGLSEEYNFEDLNTECIYNPLYEEIPDSISYTMRDGNIWNLNEAVKYAENFYNSYLTKLEMTECKYLVQTVVVQRFENNTYGYLFEFVLQDFNGNYYESEPNYPKTENYYDKVFSDEAFPVELNSYLWVFNKEEINRFRKDIGFNYKQAADSGDKLLTLESAINLLGDKLADKKALQIDCAELNYVLYCKKYDIWQKWYDGKWYDYCKENNFDFLNDKEIRSDAYLSYNAITDCELQLRPTWVFRTVDTNLTDYNAGETYYVDAVTGEIQVIR